MMHGTYNVKPLICLLIVFRYSFRFLLSRLFSSVKWKETKKEGERNRQISIQRRKQQFFLFRKFEDHLPLHLIFDVLNLDYSHYNFKLCCNIYAHIGGRVN